MIHAGQLHIPTHVENLGQIFAIKI